MSKRRISEEKIREMQMKSGGRGPGWWIKRKTKKYEGNN